MIMAEHYVSLRMKFIALFSYSDSIFQVVNVKKTLFGHFSKNPVTAPIHIDDNVSISSIDEKDGYVYLGMIFLPTDDFSKILY